MRESLIKRIYHLAGVEFSPVDHLEKLVSAFGGFVGILVVAWSSAHFVGTHAAPLIVASMGASAVLLFAVPHGPLSQPWPLVGGHLVSALIGVACAQWIPDILVAAAVAVSLAIGAMHYLRCIHPPGGATALTAVVGGAGVHALGYGYVLAPVLFNVGVILSAALLVNYLFPWRRYPVGLVRPRKEAARPAPDQLEEQTGITHGDLEYALREIDSFIDVTEDDLARIYTLAAEHSAHRHLQPSQILVGRSYSNGRYGENWEVREVVDASGDADPAKDLVVYKVVGGMKRRSSGTCTREEFARWAKYEVSRGEYYWQRVPQELP
jgi:CBS domain-containing membrane protein